MNRFEPEHPSPDHERVRAGLRLAGPVVALAGLLLTLVGVGSFFSAFGSGEFGPPRYFWCAFLGLPLIWLGTVLSGAGYLGAVQGYVARESAPAQKEAFRNLAAGATDGVRSLARAIGDGFSARRPACPRCRAALPDGARFCPGCGAPFAAATCGKCGTQAVPGAKFCHGCGASLRESEIA